ncbi:NAD(P)/FAD-dependent oxidoreductase [Jatrophihabitans sp. YIM 134969]
MDDERRRRIAVIGSGVAGLTAAHVLQRECDVTLFEADDRVGGHAHTHELLDDAGDEVDVDTGFIVHNRVTYPNLIRLFDELGVETQESDMSMSIRCEGCGLEYAGGRGISGLLPTWRTSLRPRYLRMLADVVRFHRFARTALVDGDEAETVEHFARRHHFSDYFVGHFLTPLVAAVWSVAPDQAGSYPAHYLFRFLQHHGMLQVTGSPTWRTVTHGSARYVEKVAKQLTQVRVSTPVRSVRRVADGVEVEVEGRVEHFDAAVVATHPEQALGLLAEPTDAERDVLSRLPYSTNPTVLHHDTSVLPRAERAGASWNYVMSTCEVHSSQVRVSYDMNRLQRLSTATRYVVTLNDDGLIPAEQVVDRMIYQHPVYTPDSTAAQRLLPTLSDSRLAFAGAYHGWGFHEDGARSGAEAARILGVDW